MGKRARSRARRQLGRQPTPKSARVDLAGLFEKLAGDTDAYVRLLRPHDTAAEPLRPLLDTENPEVLAALIEPARDALIHHGEGTYDVRIAIATKMGLPLAGPIASPLAAGWTFGPRQGKWELTDPTGTLISRCDVTIEDSAGEPAWTAQAIAAGQVLVVYGTRVGVRVPEGVAASRYDDEYRAAELDKSLTSRQACAAIVRFPQQINAFRRVTSR